MKKLDISFYEVKYVIKESEKDLGANIASSQILEQKSTENTTLATERW